MFNLPHNSKLDLILLDKNSILFNPIHNNFTYIEYTNFNIPYNAKIQLCFYLDYLVAIRFNIPNFTYIKNKYHTLWDNLNQHNLIKINIINSKSNTLMDKNTFYYPCIEYLNYYFLAKRIALNIKLAILSPLNQVISPFQFDVLNALYHLVSLNQNNLSTYSHIANYINNKKAVRAVASVIANNPIPIFIPCHRILPKNSKFYIFQNKLNPKDIGKYMYGANFKAYLLNLEFI